MFVLGHLWPSYSLFFKKLNKGFITNQYGRAKIKNKNPTYYMWALEMPIIGV
jgi:hypothetical protein